ncbi:hypothetical protein O181_001803 [Austropuccinia psidii MF-1]|uniref:Uncharacterized protein n=1 Tax=Austropuccinia psidii MF-1 TaxID=1389203 RepID=A0A9Q3BBJ5_9BASI|nr:hypothetical protein [Austropuccinia psidii MF-1]
MGFPTGSRLVGRVGIPDLVRTLETTTKTSMAPREPVQSSRVLNPCFALKEPRRRAFYAGTLESIVITDETMSETVSRCHILIALCTSHSVIKQSFEVMFYKAIGSFLVFCIINQATLATNHTQCFNYFMTKDKCIHSAADDRIRCPRNPKEVPEKSAGVITHDDQKQKPLQRRYDSISKSFPIAPGTGICGPYKDDQPGVCLWVGSEQVKGDNISTAGWLNGAKTSNCRKEVFIQRRDNLNIRAFAPVVDGNAFLTPSASNIHHIRCKKSSFFAPLFVSQRL